MPAMNWHQFYKVVILYLKSHLSLCWLNFFSMWNTGLGTVVILWMSWPVFLPYLLMSGIETPLIAPPIHYPNLFLPLMPSLADHTTSLANSFSLLEMTLASKFADSIDHHFRFLSGHTTLPSSVPTTVLEVFIYQMKHVVYFHHWQGCFMLIHSFIVSIDTVNY